MSEHAGRISRLEETLRMCPADIASRCELAILLEEDGAIPDALHHWRVVLSRDPNHLNAWEGVLRCRQALTRREQVAVGLPLRR